MRKGQTLASIARANGVSAEVVAETNYLTPGRRLRPGTDLVIPIPPARPLREAEGAVPPVRRAAAPRPPRACDRAVPDRAGRHAQLDRRGAHGTTVGKLQAWNGLKGTRIAVGEVLTIYTDEAR